MRQLPWEPGLYDVEIEVGKGVAMGVMYERHYYDGRNWTGLRGKLGARGWRGMATPNGEAA